MEYSFLSNTHSSRDTLQNHILRHIQVQDGSGTMTQAVGCQMLLENFTLILESVVVNMLVGIAPTLWGTSGFFSDVCACKLFPPSFRPLVGGVGGVLDCSVSTLLDGLL